MHKTACIRAKSCRDISVSCLEICGEQASSIQLPATTLFTKGSLGKVGEDVGKRFRQLLNPRPPLSSEDKTRHWQLLQNQMIPFASSAHIPPLKESLRQQAPPLTRLTEIVMSFVAWYSQRSEALEGATFWQVGNGRGEAQAQEEEGRDTRQKAPQELRACRLHKAKAETQGRGGSDVGKKWQMRRVGSAEPSCSPCSRAHLDIVRPPAHPPTMPGTCKYLILRFL